MIAVSPAAPADWELVRDLRLRALADAPGAFASTLEREAAYEDGEWQRRVADGHWWSARTGGRSIGLVAAVAGTSTTDRHLVSMWVAPDHRGGGAAAALVEAVCAWAADDGAETVSLWVVGTNERARRFYDRLGFAPTGERQPLPGAPEVTEERRLRRLVPGSSPSPLRRGGEDGGELR